MSSTGTNACEEEGSGSNGTFRAKPASLKQEPGVIRFDQRLESGVAVERYRERLQEGLGDVGSPSVESSLGSGLNSGVGSSDSSLVGSPTGGGD